MKTLGDLLVEPLKIAIEADVSDAVPTPNRDCKAEGSKVEGANDRAETMVGKKRAKKRARSKKTGPSVTPRADGV
jgi:hypothetical protein